LRLGVQFSNGRKATSIDHRAWTHGSEDAPDNPVLVPHGGGGGGRRSWERALWLWPLPPPGPLAFVCEWPSEGIDLARVETDSAVVLDAAKQAETLWED
jgi:hypothetical protein